MCFRRSFPTKHSRDGINTLLHKQRIANHKNCVTRALSRFRFFVTSTFIKVTGRSRRDEDGIDWYVTFRRRSLFPSLFGTENFESRDVFQEETDFTPSSDIHVFADSTVFA